MATRKKDAPEPTKKPKNLRIRLHTMTGDARKQLDHWVNRKNRAPAYFFERISYIPITKAEDEDIHKLADEYREAGWTVKLNCKEGTTQWSMEVS